MKRTVAAAAMLAALTSCEDSSRPDATAANDAASATNAAVASSSPAAPVPADRNMARFANSSANAVSDSLRQNYVDFSFEYPSDWTVTPQRNDGTDRNFVRVAAPHVDGYEPFAFHVGYASANTEAERAGLEQALPQLAEQFGSSMQDYRVTAIGRDQVGSYESMTWRFSAIGPAMVKGGRPAQIYGRGDIVLPPGTTRGVTIISLVSDRANEVRDAGEVGESGTLKAVFDSFRLNSSGK